MGKMIHPNPNLKNPFPPLSKKCPHWTTPLTIRT